MKRYLAEFFGTFWLVFGGCGSAIFAAAFPELGIGFVGVAFAFGLTVLTMAYAVGHISGGHFNPAVSVGLLVGGRFDKKTSCLTSSHKLSERSQLLLCYILSLQARLDLTLLQAVLLATDTASTHQMVTV
ncbi:aquaporin [Campylobacter concisus]